MRFIAKAGICLIGFAAAGAAIAAPVTPPGVIVTSITAGVPDPGGKVPTLNGVPGAVATNIDLTMPQAILVHGNSYFFSVTSANTTYTGTCKDNFRLMQVQNGKSVQLMSGVVKKSYNCAVDDTWAWTVFSKAIPNSPGPATLIGTVIYGGHKNEMIAHVVIQ